MCQSEWEARVGQHGGQAVCGACCWALRMGGPQEGLARGAEARAEPVLGLGLAGSGGVWEVT